MPRQNNLLTSIKVIGPVILMMFLALILRTVGLSHFPAGLYIDEAGILANAISLQRAGADEHGRVWPYWFESFGEYKLPVYIYAVYLTLFMIDQPEWATRLPSALAGTLSVGLIYFIFTQLWPKQPRVAAWFVAGTMAIVPWSIQLSRGGFEANLGLLFSLALIASLGWAQKHKSVYLLIPILAVLGMSTYNSNRLVIPLILLICVCYYRINLLRWSKSLLTKFGLICLGLAIWFVPIQLQDHGYVRAEQTLIKGDSWIETSEIFLKQSAQHLDSYFLFFRGDQIGRHATRKHGMLFISLIPLLGIGLYQLSKSRSQLSLFTGLIFISILPAAITQPSPHGLRSLHLLPFLILIAGLGFGFAWNWWKKFPKVRLSLALFLCLAMVYELAWYGMDYSLRYHKAQEMDWGGGYQRVLDRAMELRSDEEKIYLVTHIPEVYLLVSGLIEAEELQAARAYGQTQFERVEYLDSGELDDVRGLIIDFGGNQPDKDVWSEPVYYLNGDLAFWIWRQDATN